MAVKIRRATKKDLKDIAKILKAEFAKPPYNEKWSDATSLKRIKEYLDDFLYVAELERKVVGFISFRYYSWDTCLWGWIDDVAVSKKFKRKGIGTLLMKKAEEILKAKGVKNISFLVHKKSSSINMHKKLNYSEGDYVYFSKELK